MYFVKKLCETGKYFKDSLYIIEMFLLVTLYISV